MFHSQEAAALADERHLTPSTGPGRRDSDRDGNPRIHDEELVRAAKRAAVTMAAAAIHALDNSTGKHCDDVAHLCDAIADELDLRRDDRAALLAAAQLHDIGKLGLPQQLLDKPGPLDDLEWALIRKHTLTGEQIIRSVPELEEISLLVRHSHERWDGGGYPDGLAGERISLASRIVFSADAFHAIRSDRPYRRGRPAQAALAEVSRNAGAQFDPQVTDALVEAAGRTHQAPRDGADGLWATLRSRRLVSLLTASGSGRVALGRAGACADT